MKKKKKQMIGKNRKLLISIITWILFQKKFENEFVVILMVNIEA